MHRLDFMVIYPCLISESFLKYFRCFGTRQSLRARNRQRKAQGLESYQTALERTINQKPRNKNHTGNISNYSFDKPMLLQEVNDLNVSDTLNLSELARKVHLLNADGKIPENGGQILKFVLESEGFDLSKFTSANKGRKRSLENDAENKK